MSMLLKVISGGQTGVDQIGLDVARSRAIPTGGTAPKAWKIEGGYNPCLANYGLIESPHFGYPPRTEQNVVDADATVLFGDVTSGGSLLTINLCIKRKKRYKTNPTSKELADWIESENIEVLNVAGNRGSKLSTAQKSKITDILTDAFKLLGY